MELVQSLPLKKIRSSLEFELKEDMVKQQRAKQVVTETNTRARDIFNNMTEEINLKCPRCMTVFHDYDGCNALICATGSCKAAFCAIFSKIVVVMHMPMFAKSTDLSLTKLHSRKAKVTEQAA